ncbi:uncharacterized protein M421DRAFT_391418 [Didymella exigua CBS 183.55]|uniref:Uncharacterized protein n=1 Tax=Didymella exigua CBS 183.55 TaxID=1150837 RepID=A0A6A5RJP4_9PLEO|nr:uncharacterized protein M421DRAFT_391418 [Didymella exigua CBS 183.55]KAF1928585.1 hypothetical protein M421DRAFT_391418 [Didymella exigua CBS 183.55]
MKATPYFQRTLLYDLSPAATEHYERCADQVFELESSATRIGVCFQSCKNGPGSGEAKNTTGPFFDEGSIVPLKNCQEMLIYERLKGSSDDDTDNSSILSVASSTALPVAMDQRQENSGPPVYPGVPKLVSGEITSGEIVAFVERTKHDFRVFYLRQRHSLSQLHITKGDFELLVRSCQAFLRFNEYVTAFGKRSEETEVGPPPLKFRDLYTARGNAYRGFECADILRYIEFTNRGRHKDPWSLRQFGVYHRFKMGSTPCSTCILSDKANGVSISTEDDPNNFVKITPDDHLELKDIEDRATHLILCLDSTCDTLTSFEEMYDQFCQRQDNIRLFHPLDAVDVALKDKVKEI